MSTNANDIFDVCVIGGGVVGLAILRAATLAGYQCVLAEKEADLLSGASGSNSGIACTGVDASIGSLERALIRDAIAQLRPYLVTMNVPYRAGGSLVCAWSWDDDKDDDDQDDLARQQRLDHVLAESHDAGDAHAITLTPAQVAQLEPAIRHDCLHGAVHIPGEMVLDPWLYSISLACHARENGATVHTNWDVDANQLCFDKSGIWTVVRQRATAPCSSGPNVLRTRTIVNATGVLSDQMERAVHGSCGWRAAPRRGQYRIYRNPLTHTALTRPIQPVPSQFTKGVFVFSTLYDQIVAGPTAQTQASCTDRSIDVSVAADLDQIAARTVPSLRPAPDYCIGEYVGIRPATDQRDYQIRTLHAQHWISVASIRSTGLTASLGIGRHVVQCCLSSLLRPEAAAPKPFTCKTTPLPAVSALVQNFHSRSDDCVEIAGHVYRVTHPLTRLGWQGRTGIAAAAPGNSDPY